MELRNKLISCIKETGNYYQIIKIIVSKHAILLCRKVHIIVQLTRTVFFFNNAWI